MNTALVILLLVVVVAFLAASEFLGFFSLWKSKAPWWRYLFPVALFVALFLSDRIHDVLLVASFVGGLGLIVFRTVAVIRARKAPVDKEGRLLRWTAGICGLLLLVLGAAPVVAVLMIRK